MQLPEEIEELKTQIAQTTDEQLEAELILTLLKKHASLKSTQGHNYIQRLLQLSQKLDSINYRAWALYFDANNNHLNDEYEASISLANEALLLFSALKDIRALAHTHILVGLSQSGLGNYQEALKNYTRALQLRIETGDSSGAAMAHNCIGGVYETLGNYPTALKNYLQALKIKEEIGDKLGTAYSCNNVGNIYCKIGNYPEAMKSYERALLLGGEEIEGKQSLSGWYNNIGAVQCQSGNYAEALKSYVQALQLAIENGNKQWIAGSYNNIGEVYCKLDNLSEALKNQQLALNIWLQLRFKDGISNSYLNMGEVYEKQGEHNTALQYKQLALQLSEETGQKDMIKESAFSLYVTYKSLGDIANALSCYEKFHALENEILGKQVQLQLSNLTFQKDIELKDKELEIQHLRNVELKTEKERSENLLLNILPAEVAEELKANGSAAAKQFDDVTVMFTDFVSFTKVSEQLTPQQLVNELHTCFSAFDAIISKYGIEKIKTMGDGFIAAAGLPLANTNHSEDMIKAAREICHFMATRQKQNQPTFQIRIGIHSGPVVAGIVGVKKFAYDIWGDTVNTAARMEQNSEAGKINISEATYELVKDKFNCEYRGEIEAKNKGRLKMYFVDGLR